MLKRDAVPRVVMNNLYKHTPLQDTFGCNMLALVDKVPRTLRLDQFISYWVQHQMEVIQRRTQYRLNAAEKRAHLLRGLVKALNMLDDVIALIRASKNAEAAREGLKDLLGIDDDQANHILNTQLRNLAAMEIAKVRAQLAELEALIKDLADILANESRQRQIISTELNEIVSKYGDDRRTQIIRADGDLSEEDFIPDEEMVITITHGGYAKRTRTDQYRLQRRGGKGVKGATLRGDDEVQHMFATSNHHWILFFTDKGRVYRSKVWQLPEGSRDAKGGHVAQLLSFQPDEKIAQVLAIRSYEDAPYLLLACKSGLVKKSALTLFDSPRAAGVIAINFRNEDDVLIGAALCHEEDDVLLVTKNGQSIRFSASDEQLRPMGRATSGVTGMKFRGDDQLLSMSIIDHDMPEDDRFVFCVTDGGFAKRTAVREYRRQNRGGLGIKAMKLDTDSRGSLVGALVVSESDEVIAMKSSGQITRSAVAEVAVKGRDTMGVKFVGVKGQDNVIAISINPEQKEESESETLNESDTVNSETLQVEENILDTAEDPDQVKRDQEDTGE